MYIHKLGTTRRWPVNFNSHSLYPRWNNQHYRLNRRLSGHQNQSARAGEKKNILCLWKYKTQFSDLPAHKPMNFAELTATSSSRRRRWWR